MHVTETLFVCMFPSQAAASVGTGLCVTVGGARAVMDLRADTGDRAREASCVQVKLVSQLVQIPAREGKERL